MVGCQFIHGMFEFAGSLLPQEFFRRQFAVVARFDRLPLFAAECLGELPAGLSASSSIDEQSVGDPHQVGFRFSFFAVAVSISPDTVEDFLEQLIRIVMGSGHCPEVSAHGPTMGRHPLGHPLPCYQFLVAVTHLPYSFRLLLSNVSVT